MPRSLLLVIAAVTAASDFPVRIFRAAEEVVDAHLLKRGMKVGLRYETCQLLALSELSVHLARTCRISVADFKTFTCEPWRLVSTECNYNRISLHGLLLPPSSASLTCQQLLESDATTTAVLEILTPRCMPFSFDTFLTAAEVAPEALPHTQGPEAVAAAAWALTLSTARSSTVARRETSLAGVEHCVFFPGSGESFPYLRIFSESHQYLACKSNRATNVSLLFPGALSSLTDCGAMAAAIDLEALCRTSFDSLQEVKFRQASDVIELRGKLGMALKVKADLYDGEWKFLELTCPSSFINPESGEANLIHFSGLPEPVQTVLDRYLRHFSDRFDAFTPDSDEVQLYGNLRASWISDAPAEAIRAELLKFDRGSGIRLTRLCNLAARRANLRHDGPKEVHW